MEKQIYNQLLYYANSIIRIIFLYNILPFCYPLPMLTNQQTHTHARNFQPRRTVSGSGPKYGPTCPALESQRLFTRLGRAANELKEINFPMEHQSVMARYRAALNQLILRCKKVTIQDSHFDSYPGYS